MPAATAQEPQGADRARSRAPASSSGDPDRLRQIVWNLVANAVKFTPRGGRVTVRVERAPPAAVRLVVEDTGEGIARRLPAPRLRALPPGRLVEHAQPRRPRPGAGRGPPPRRAARRARSKRAAKGRGAGATFTVVLPVLDPAQLSPAAPVAGATPTASLVGGRAATWAACASSSWTTATTSARS